jgi:hypothetical protein
MHLRGHRPSAHRPALLRSLEGDLYESAPSRSGRRGAQVSFTVTTPTWRSEQAIVEVPWSRMSPRPLAGEVSVDVDVPWEVRSALAPGFELDEERDGPGRLGLGWESTPAWDPDANFRLYLSGGEGLIDTRLLAHREQGEDGYFSLLFAPVVDLDESVARDIVLVIDRSGSMEGEKMAQAIDAAAYVLDNLGPDDRFAVVDFSRYIRTFDEKLRPAEDAEAGIEYVRDIESGGNTNFSGALERMEFLEERPGTVIFLTDGLPRWASSRPTASRAHRRRLERTQVFLRRGIRRRPGVVMRRCIGSSRHRPEEDIETGGLVTGGLLVSPTSVSASTGWSLIRAGGCGIFAGTRLSWPAIRGLAKRP